MLKIHQQESNLSGIGVATPSLSIMERLSITLKAGTKASDFVVLDNYNGLADGTFSLKEIRSGAAARSRICLTKHQAYQARTYLQILLQPSMYPMN